MSKLMQLPQSPYKAGLFTLASDPSVSDNDPAKTSYRFSLDALPAVGRPWNVTPQVFATITPDLSYVDTFNTDPANTTGISIDPLSPIVMANGNVPLKHACVKTNINLGLLQDGDCWHIALDAYASAAFNMASLLILDSNKDALEAAAVVLDFLLDDESNNRLAMLTAGSVQNNIQLSEKLNEHDGSGYVSRQLNASGFPFSYSLAGATLSDQRAVMLLSRSGGTLNIGAGMFDTVTQQYDIRGFLTMGDNEVAVDFNQLSLFISLLTINTGDGFSYINASTLLTEGLPAYNVEGTKYESGGGTQLAWDAAFPVTPHRPSGTLVEQATFPTDVRVGELLNATLDAGYAAPYPVAPYGKTVLNNTLLYVTNVTLGQQGFERMVLGTEFDALASQISTIGGGGDTAVGEIVVYVDNGIVNTDEISGGSNAYASMDEAYEYLITLPKYIRKRMVIDDRQLDPLSPTFITITGLDPSVSQKTYFLRRNNIVISTYQAYVGAAWPDYMVGSSGPNRPSWDINAPLRLNFLCDGVHVEKFWGCIDAAVPIPAQSQPMFHLNELVATPFSATLQPALLIGDYACVWGGYAAIDFIHGGRIAMVGESFLFMSFGSIALNGVDYPVTITSGIKSRIELNGVLVQPNSGSSYGLEIYRPHGSPVINYTGSFLAEFTHEFLYDDLKDTGFRLDDAVIIRTQADFGPTEFDPTGGFYITLPPKDVTYIVVGTVDLQTFSLRPGPVVGAGRWQYNFFGLADSKLFNYVKPVFTDRENYAAIFQVRGVDIVNGNGASSAAGKRSIDTAFSSWTISNAKLVGKGGVRLDDQSIYAHTVNHVLDGVTVDMQYSESEPNTIRATGRTSIKNLRVLGHSGGTVVIDMTSNDDAPTVDIVGMEVEYIGEPTRALFRIGSVGHAYKGSINVKNINVVPTQNAQGYPLPMCLFETDAATFHPHSLDPRIVTDVCGDWANYRTDGPLNIPIAAQSQVYAFTLPDTGGGGFIEGNRFNFTGGKLYKTPSIDRLYRFQISGRMTCVNANTVLEFGVVFDSDDGYPLSTQKAYTDNNAVAGSFNVSVLAHWRGGGVSPTVKNLTDGNPVSLSDIIVQITQA